MKSKKKQNFNFYKSYINNYYNTFSNDLLRKVQEIETLLLKKIKNNKNIFVCGNGGSASISNHFLCDFNKGIKNDSRLKLKPKVQSLTNNIELITAIGNDINFNDLFSFQLENYANEKDVFINFTCSGKSINVIKAAKYAKKKKLDVISLVGFNEKSKLKNFSNIFLNLNIKNYGISEDIFQSIMHMISQNIRRKYIVNKNFII